MPSQEPQPASSPKQILANRDLMARILLIAFGILVLSGAVFVVGLGAGFLAARLTGQAAPVPPREGAVPGKVEAINPEDFRIFWEAIDLVEQEFFGPLPDSKDMTYGAIRGVLDLLNDPNTSFLTPDEAQSFMESMEGTFEGIGATVEWDEELKAVRIVEPFENQPAWNAGLRRGDLIIKIDGEPVSEMSGLTEAITKIKGPKGTKVVLTILRPGESPEPFDVEVVRDVIQIPLVFSDQVGENQDIAHIRLSRFSENAGRSLRQAVNDALDQDPRGLILDLRGNPGGLLREAVSVSSIFLEDKVVLIERFSDGTEQVYRTEGSPAVPEDLPIVVLVNEGTASASEIVAGALQDHGRAVLVGTVTFGKGSVQLPHRLSDGSLLRVTVAKWFTPNGRSIDGTGLEPDIQVELTEEDVQQERDPQLERAIELLQSGQ